MSLAVDTLISKPARAAALAIDAIKREKMTLEPIGYYIG